MKKFIKNNIFGFIIGVIVTLSIGVFATIVYNANEISFNPDDSNWNVTNVEEAINDIKDNYVPKTNYVGTEYTFDYTGNYQEFVIPYTGLYKIELWGSQGGVGTNSAPGGKGGYTYGEITLTKGETLYIYVGSQGGLTSSLGWNGGGQGSVGNGAAGGGATDVRLVAGSWNDVTSLRSRIMVAGAGGGGGHNYAAVSGEDSHGGYAGGFIGTSGSQGRAGTQYSNTTLATGGTQVSGGTGGYGNLVTATAGSLGQGGSSTGSWGGGGGSGYYGGGAGGTSDGSISSGAGGSSYISGYTGCVAITSASSSTPISGCTTGTSDVTCSYHYSGKKFINSKMIDGANLMPTHDGTSTMTGNSGNGYAKITLVSID